MTRIIRSVAELPGLSWTGKQSNCADSKKEMYIFTAAIWNLIVREGTFNSIDPVGAGQHIPVIESRTIKERHD